MKKELQTLQTQLQAHIIDEESQVPKHTFIGSENDHFIQKRLGVYKNAYILRLQEALEADFPKLHTYLGPKKFSDVTRDYITHYPSVYFSLRDFGCRFPLFLQNQGDEAPPEWAELAAFEWALVEVLDAPDYPSMTKSALMSLPQDAWPTLQLQLQPSIRFIKLTYNVVTLWKAIEEKQHLPEKIRLPETQHWCVWRKEFSAHFELKSPSVVWALHTIQKGATFADICEGLCEWFNEQEAANQAIQFLRNGIDQQLFRQET